MNTTYQHFVGYHNTEKMGGPIEAGTALRVWTNKATKRLEGNIVWMIAGEGNKPRKYSLASVFRVTETGETGDEALKHYAQGPGEYFDQPIDLTALDWFDDLSKMMNRFQFGVQELKDKELITKLIAVSKYESPS